MGEILGLGCPHGPQPQLTDETMADNYFRNNLKSDKTPAHWKDLNNWPADMREEWGDDESVAAARRHRAEVFKGYRQAREAIDAFKPDFVLIFGDDQYENFKEDVLPPFCVYAQDEFNFKITRETYRPGQSVGVRLDHPPMQETVRGSKAIGTELANGLVEHGFDVSCSWKLHHASGLGHAFTRTVDYLDWDRKGFPYPLIPFHVSCYGEDLRIPTPEAETVVGRLMEGVAVKPPVSPPPWRCYDVGKALSKIIADSPYRAVIAGSSSWSHASLTDMHGHLWADVDSDREHLEQLRTGRFTEWRNLDPQQLRRSGQHEMLNWICLAGAMEGRTPRIL
ncbi:MAG TPA: extradiol ring-cleavage dioxygenase, partial [Chloroflexota bacterium]|nr:extradiol ring-cleavage dioxygenase [Chloroflexota bacterium]